jgi:soluble lytic murein transglycosylase-like protein
MPRSHAFPPSEKTTASIQGGCLSEFLIPPLAVVFVGIILAFFLLGSGMTPTQTAAPGTSGAQSTSGLNDQTATFTVTSLHQTRAISSIFEPEIQYWSDAIRAWATAAELDPNLVATVMQIESCGDPRALSRAGAMGLFQVMPYHFAKGDDPYSPDTNATRGLAYLKRSLKAARGNIRLALAGYNGGIGIIGRSESSWAAQTQRYAYWGSGIYAEASNGSTKSLRLKDWVTVNGASLCRQAHSRLGIKP